MIKDNNKNDNKHANWKAQTILFMSSQAISLFGSALVQFALIWYIARSTNSGIMVTISTICSFLPQLVISLFAGVWADRYNRKILIILSDAAIATSTLILAIVFLLGYNSIWLLFVVAAIRSFGAGIQTPAVSAMIPQIVPEEQLMRVNSINGTIMSMIFFVAPAVGGAILVYGAIEYILLIDVFTALIAITIMFTLKVPSHKKALEKQDTDYFYDLKEGIKYSFKNNFVRRLISFYSVTMFLVVPAAFLNVLMVTRTYGNEYWKLTANEMCFFAGSILGGIIMSSWGGFKNRVISIAVGCLAFGGLTVAIGVIDQFYVYLGIMVLTGMTMPLFNVPSMVLLQEKVENSMQGRVFSFVQIAGSGIMPLGMAIFGPLADVVRIQVLMIVSGAALILVGISIFYNKPFLKEGIKTVEEVA
ncbi:MAG: transporter [Clostridia bacterium]|jgi:DHA3 family macrolide efflux protein-like MFS transporter|nr:transporter [Clostridia bacterium]